MAAAFPQTYDEWRRCITVDCGIELTAAFIDERLRALRDPSDAHTDQFITQYGERYLALVIEWFEHARSEPGLGQPV